MLTKQDRDVVISRYLGRFEEYGVDVRTINYGSEKKQLAQHAVHASLGDFRGKTLLDVGCGLGFFYEYLIEQDRAPGTYIGYDMVAPFIEANRERFPDSIFEELDASSSPLLHEPDYVTMCQVFNNRYEAGNNVELVQEVISKTFAAAKVGVSIDMLSSHVNYEEPHLFYYSPEAMFTFAKSLTRFVQLRHDYLPFDFTLLLYKEARS